MRYEIWMKTDTGDAFLVSGLPHAAAKQLVTNLRVEFPSTMFWMDEE